VLAEEVVALRALPAVTVREPEVSVGADGALPVKVRVRFPEQPEYPEPTAPVEPALPGSPSPYPPWPVVDPEQVDTGVADSAPNVPEAAQDDPPPPPPAET